MKGVIYTAISNNYDSLKEPKEVTEGWRYICYTNNKHLSSNIWEVIYDETLNSVKRAREIKIVSPFKVSQSIWVDGSMLINCNLDHFVNEYCKKDFTLMNHPHRNCIYDEAIACIKRGKDDRMVINRQIDLYKKEGYNKGLGLVATGVIYRKYNDKIDDFCFAWNKEVQKHSCRDQLSFNYVANKMNLDYHTIPFTILNKEFLLNKHNK